MLEFKQHLKDWLVAQKQQLVDNTIKLISEDEPKNKFSIIAGKMKMIEDIESEINIYEHQERES